MRNVQSRWAQGRRKTIIGTLVATGLIAVAPLQTADAQTSDQSTPSTQSTQSTGATAQQSGTEQQAQQSPYTFTSDGGVLLMYVKPDKTADFEGAMAKLHEALMRSDKPERKQQAAGWKLFKAAEPGPDNSVMYVNVLSPVVKGADYSPTKILAEVYPTEVQQIYQTLRDALARGGGKLTLALVQDFGSSQPAAGAPPTTGTGTPGQAGTSTTGAAPSGTGTATPGSTTPPSTQTPPRQ